MAIPVFPGEVPGSGIIYKRGQVVLPIRDSLALWFRYGVGISASAAGAVNTWRDMSGNGRDLKQGTGANQPTRQGDGSILFDGSAHRLSCDAFTLVQPTTVYLLMRQITWTSGDIFCDGNASGTLRIQQSTSSPGVALNAGAVLGPNNGMPLGVYAPLVAVFNGANSLIQLGSAPATSGAGGTNNAGGFSLGAALAGAFSNIEVKEVVVYAAAHDATQRFAVQKYLAKLGKVAI